MPELDGVRAVAIALVLLQHLAPADSLVGDHGPVPTGVFGVDLFFVLSGFLITRQLLQLAESGAPLATRWRTFIARRALRLLPLSTAVIAAAWLADWHGFRAFWTWFAAFAANWYLGWVDHVPQLAVFWSLAVEEQFYLLWPVVIWTVPRRHLPAVCLAVAAVGPLIRLVLLTDGAALHTVRYTTPAIVDPLAIGSWLAVRRGGVAGPAVVAALGTPLVLTAWALVGVRASVIPLSTVIACGAAVAVHLAWTGRLPALKWRPAVWVGQRSYGIYLLHLPVLAMVDAALAPGPLARTTLVLAGTVVAAELAHRWIERPFNQRKADFPV